MSLVEGQEQLPVAAARAGDAAAWDDLIRRYQLPVYVYVFELVRHEQDALDLVQETFVRAIRYLDGLREDARFGAWLFGIAHQRVVEHWRRKSRNQNIFAESTAEDEGEVPDPRESPAEWLLRQEDLAALQEAMGRLPLGQRTVLLLQFIEGF